MDRQRLTGLDGVHVVNLKRRPDRLQLFMQQSGLRRGEFHQHHAVDAARVPDMMGLDQLFSDAGVFNDANVVAHALSHMHIIKRIAATQNELHLILEDDASFADNWIDKWNTHISAELPADAFARADWPAGLTQ